MRRAIFLFVLILCIFASGSVGAETFKVSSVIELQNALTAAQDNGQDDAITLAPGTYTVTTALTYFPAESENFALTIQGAGAASTVVDGGKATPLLQIDQADLLDGTKANLAIRGITFRNGNDSSMMGGAVSVGNYYAETIIEDSIFQDNKAAYGGGALYLSGWSGSISRCTFIGNSCDYANAAGGALYLNVYGEALSLDGNTFSNNSSGGNGAGMFASTSGQLDLTGNSFSGNKASGEGGGAYIESTGGGPLNILGNQFDGNSASSSGGALIAGPASISHNIFRNNVASGSKQSYGGGLTAYSDDSAEIINNLFAGNKASQHGGGAVIQVSKNQSQLINNTFADNISTGEYDQSDSLGGGFYAITYMNNGIVNIYNNIFWGNRTASPDGGGADYYINDDGNNDGSGSILNLYNNDFSNAKILRQTNLHQGGNINEDPKLGADYRLEAGSPCIDAGSSSAPQLPAMDLAGSPRIQDGNNSGTSIVDMGAYESAPTGFLDVTIVPDKAIDAGARWRIVGGFWQVSGSVHKISVGQYIIEFSELTGWTKPANQTVVIREGQTTSIDGAYTVQTGSLQVTINPQAAVDAGSQWRIDGGNWRISGYMESLEVGQYTLEFSELSGWTKPADQTVTITYGQTTAVTGSYTTTVQTGSLQVTIEPQAAADAGAKWRVDGGAWHSSGDTESGLSIGKHQIELSAVSDWTPPPNQSVTITNGQTASLSVTYVQIAGSLKVTISPKLSVDRGARWRVDGGPWQDSGDTQGGLSVGEHLVAFILLDGWDRPENQTVTIRSEQTTVIDATYKSRSGAGWGTLGGTGVSSTAEVAVKNGESGGGRGYTDTASPSVQRNVDSARTTAPRPEGTTVTRSPVQPADTRASTRAQIGSPTAAANPEGSSSVAIQWRVDRGAWHANVYSQTDLPPGRHTIEFTNIAMLLHREKPMGIGENLVTPDDAASAVRQTGSQTSAVPFTPPVEAARPRPEPGGRPGSGSTNTQAPLPASVATDQTGFLVVAIDPPEASVAGARWRVDGGVWQKSEFMERGLSPGKHTIEFSDPPGWKKPADQTVSINQGQTTMTFGTFVKGP